MIDYFALALGHGLMAIALLRLLLRHDLEVDPLLDRLKADMAANRKAASAAGRSAARSATPGKDEVQPETAGTLSRAPAAER